MTASTDAKNLRIWDTCFSTFVTRYAGKAFPSVRGMDNFYKPIIYKIASPIKIDTVDQTPLFAWVE